MKKLSLLAIVPLFLVSILPACAEVSGDAIPPFYASGWTAPVKRLCGRLSPTRLAAYLRQVSERLRRERQAAAKNMAAPAPTSLSSVAGLADAKSADAAESITNVQHAA